MDSLLNLKSLSHRVPYELLIYVVLTPGREPRKKPTSSTSSSSTSSTAAAAAAVATSFTVAELENWYRERKLKVKTYQFSKRTNLTLAYADVIGTIRRKFPEATVLLTETDVNFDVGFLERCRAVVRAGKQIYQPLPKHTVFTEARLMYGQSRQVIETMWTGHPRPVCAHVSDLRGTHRRKQAKHAALKAKNIKVLSALDVGLTMLY